MSDGVKQPDDGIIGEACFRVNKDGCILLFEKLGHKVIAQCAYPPKLQKKNRKSHKGSQHRMQFIELDTSVQVKGKTVDTSNFLSPRR